MALEGSNPSLSANTAFAVCPRRGLLFSLTKRIESGKMNLVVLDGALAVPCTRNPLQAGLNSPLRAFVHSGTAGLSSVDGWVLCGGSL